MTCSVNVVLNVCVIFLDTHFSMSERQLLEQCSLRYDFGITT